MARPKTVYQLKVVLLGVKPAIWRRLQVPADITLDKLHMVLQEALGWTNSHLHHFMVGEQLYGMLDVDEYAEDLQDEKRFKLGQIVGEKARFAYEYDFGDSWEHGILVEKVLPAEPGVSYPRCLAGKRACPPEDCGGIGGYEELLKIIANPKHEEHEQTMSWLGGVYDPEAFDVWEADARLRSPRRRGWTRA